MYMNPISKVYRRLMIYRTMKYCRNLIRFNITVLFVKWPKMINEEKDDYILECFVLLAISLELVAFRHLVCKSTANQLWILVLWPYLSRPSIELDVYNWPRNFKCALVLIYSHMHYTFNFGISQLSHVEMPTTSCVKRFDVVALFYCHLVSIIANWYMPCIYLTQHKLPNSNKQRLFVYAFCDGTYTKNQCLSTIFFEEYVLY